MQWQRPERSVDALRADTSGGSKNAITCAGSDRRRRDHGVGLLYHLALEGWTDAVLVEKGELTSGSTWHAAGQCPHFNSSLNATKLHVYGTDLYSRLEALTGQAVGWHGCGGLRLACTAI